MNELIHVVDDFYDQNTLSKVQEWAKKLPVVDTWYEFENMFYGHDLFVAAKSYFDLSDAIGCEMHINYHTPNKHHDKDEELFKQTGQLKFPLCGIVYYPFVSMEGGQIIFPDASIAVTPKTNRVIFFKGDLLHDGVPFNGLRQSVGINPWEEIPLAYRR